MFELLQNGFGRLRSRWDSLRAQIDPGGARFAFNWRALMNRRALTWVLGVVAFVLLVYYPVGMLIYNDIDDNLDLQPAPAASVAGGSEAVAMAATLIGRETDHWVANKPFWHPAAMLDNTPNFQLGMIYAISRFALELGDYLGRVRGSSAIDPNLDRAAALLRYDGTTWYWGQGNIIPMAKAESQYRKGEQLLITYNHDVAAGKASYDRRADNLIALLDRIAADLGSASAELDARAEVGGGYFDLKADDVFYGVKGKLYAYYLILKALGVDFSGVVKEKQATEIWNNMLGSLRTGASMDPLIVVNGKQDSLLMPSHLSTLGFYVLRARTQMRELGDTLQK